MLAKNAPPSHLVTTFDTTKPLPTARAMKKVCLAAKVENAAGVAEVLFPLECLATTGNVQTKLEAGLAKIRRLRRSARKSLSGWSDTYFERLVGQHAQANGKIKPIGQNRVAAIIEKANSWNGDFHAAFYAHTTHGRDKLRKRGAPCLQYVQFELLQGKGLRLFAVYRSHDFINKALGNFVGLQRLGEFVAAETDRTLKEVTVISLNPFVGTKKRAKEFCDGLAQL